MFCRFSGVDHGLLVEKSNKDNNILRIATPLVAELVYLTLSIELFGNIFRMLRS